jgi:GNAT superfamily N-acetyltransferase
VSDVGLESIKLRLPTIADVPELARMHVASWRETYRGVIADESLDAITPEGFEKFHLRNFAPAAEGGGIADPKRVFWVAVERADESRIVGFSRAGPCRAQSPRGDVLPADVQDRFTAELYAIYLRPEYFGSGVGRMLLAPVLDGLRERGHTSLCVWALTENEIGRRFYERLGGKLEGEAVFTLDGLTYPQVAYGWDHLPTIRHKQT